MIKPTIGRVLHFFPHVSSAPDAHPFAALLAGINEDGTINLTVSARDGSTYPVQNVRLLQDDDVPPAEGHHAAWMPFQKGQVPASSAMEERVAKLEALLTTGGDIHRLFEKLETDVVEKVAAIETATQGKFAEVGEYLEQKFAGIEGRLNPTPETQPPAPAPAPSTQADAGAAEKQPSQ